MKPRDYFTFSLSFVDRLPRQIKNINFYDNIAAIHLIIPNNVGSTVQDTKKTSVCLLLGQARK